MDDRGVSRRRGAEREGYRGVDRRGAPVDRAVLGGPAGARAERVLLVALPVAALVVAGILAVADDRWTGMDDLGHIGVAALTAAAGTLALVRHRLTGQANAGAVGVALVGLSVLQGLSACLDGDGASWSYAQAGASAVVAAALVGAARVPVVDTGFRPLPLLATAGGGALLAGAVGALLGTEAGFGGRPAVAVAWSGVALALAAAAARCEHRSRRDHGRQGWGLDWLSAALAGLAIASAAEALGAATGRSGWIVGAHLLTVAAASAALVGTARDLVQTYTTQRGRLLVSQVEREAAEAVLEEEGAAERKRNHDVRSALTGIGGATATLEHYRDRLGPEQAERLRAGVRTEITRLQQLVAPTPVEGLDAFPLEEALRSLPIGLRGTVRQDVPNDLHARGDRTDTAAALRHLVAAVHRSHPRAVVAVRAQASGDRILIDVGPDAPGAADVGRADRMAVLAARRLVQAAGGDVVTGQGSGAGYRLELTRATVALAEAVTTDAEA